VIPTCPLRRDTTALKQLLGIALQATLVCLELERVAVSLLERSMPLPKAVRLPGVSLSTLQTDGEDEQFRFQLPIWTH
jgi:Na+-translocating ferredoxin:NAD+ oxidoreductase RnfE subunit